jgi:hypothetical protein
MDKFKIKESRVKTKKEIGVMPQWSPEAPIPRTFRWLLSSKHYPNIQLWMKSVKTDYLNKTIDIQVYDDAAGVVFNWIQSSHADDILTMAHLDAVEMPFCACEFHNLMLVGHNADYDYSKNDVLTHYVKIKYESMTRLNLDHKFCLDEMIPA